VSISPASAGQPSAIVFRAGHRAVVPRWTAAEIWRLRTAKRMSVRAFATWLGVSDRMVSKWESGTVPGPVNQATLDSALRLCSPEECVRFHDGPDRPCQPAAEPAGEPTPAPGKALVAPDQPLPDWLWEGEDVRTALREHDMRYLFKVLQHHRISQRTIARMVGMQQSEISEVLAGRRVRQYQALLRICVGLGISRHLMGLSDAEPPSAACETRVRAP
jgi:transcriptional regulator with XRE-family HTH domain